LAAHPAIVAAFTGDKQMWNYPVTRPETRNLTPALDYYSRWFVTEHVR